MFTYASLARWGGLSGDTWNSNVHHIYCLELKTVQSTSTAQGEKQVDLFLVDSTTVVAYVNKQGGTTSVSFLRLAIQPYHTFLPLLSGSGFPERLIVLTE